MARTADVVIIGGGIAGLSIGYHLVARQPGLKALVLEKNQFPGMASTAKATGGIRCQFSTAINVALSRHAVAVYRRFKEEMGQDIGFRDHGYLFVTADQEKLALMQRNVALQNSLGVPARLVSPAEIRALNPAFRVDDLVGGTFCPWDGSATPADAVAGFWARGREKGLEVLLEHTVTGFIQSGSRVQGVQTDKGAFLAGTVVNASGPWAREIAGWLGIDLPAHPYRRQVFAAAPLAEVRGDPPMSTDMDTGWYMHKELRGAILLGGTDAQARPGMAESVDWQGLDVVIAAGVRRAPILAEARVMRAWAGVRALTPDDHAVLGPVPGVEGLLLANGLGGHGFMHAPAVGVALAEWILDGRATTVDVSALTIDRFQAGRPIQEVTLL